MTALYTRIAKALKPEARAKLERSQAAWRHFRDEECAWQNEITADAPSAAQHEMYVSRCEEKLTARRIEQLKSQLDCPEGDFSCGHVGLP